MPRCEHETVLFRVFCVTLLAVALTFTLILTNVFIDIDSLLTSGKKEHVQHDISLEIPARDQDNDLLYQSDGTYDPQTDVLNNYRSDAEEDEGFRTKRSLDSKNFEHLRNPKIKEVFTKKLSTLLEELEAAEDNEKSKEKEQKLTKFLDKIVESKNTVDTTHTQKMNEEMMHLAMHNILLQGIIGHMEFKEVYKKLHSLVTAFNQDGSNVATRKQNEERNKLIDVSKELETSESKFFEELIKCDELQKQIATLTDTLPNNVFSRRAFGANSDTSRDNNWDTYLHQVKESKNPQMLIKTIIDIKTLKNKTNISPNNIKGQIKFIYNGKPIKFNGLGDDTKTIDEHARRYMDRSVESVEGDYIQDSVTDINSKVVDAFLDDAIFTYLLKHPKIGKQFKPKRLRRSVNIKLKEATTEKTEAKTKKEDDQLYIEIETPLGSDGTKDERKKKLIQQIVEKIQKAIHDSGDKTGKNLGIFKRAQSPLENKQEVFNKFDMPTVMVEREMNPIISKTAKQPNGILPQVYDQSGEVWKRANLGPRFLTPSKTINSGESGHVNLVYSNDMNYNGIPQRHQEPLSLNQDNGETISEDINYFNIGDLKFYVKEIDGTGFSIGFNQYVGEAPDPESIKPFIDGEHLIKTYNYDYDDKDGVRVNVERQNNTDFYHEVKKRDVHSRYKEIFDRLPPMSPGNQHENEYKVIFDKQYLPYDSYSEIIEDGDKKIQLAIKKDGDYFSDSFTKGSKKDVDPLFLDDNIFEKNLKPSEIFGLANLLDRRKRSPVVMKKFSNLKTRRRSRLNRYLNTNRKTKRIVVSNSRRNKRQVDKIRIIATDTISNIPRRLDDNIFVLSDENTGRNSLHEIEMLDDEPEQEESSPPEVQEGYYHPLFSEFAHPHFNSFTSRSRHNALMSKYPHLFMDEIDRSKENEDAPVFYNKLINSYSDFQNRAEITSPPFLATPVPIPIHNSPVMGRLASDIAERMPKANYKLTVKIVPKNHTDMGSGFKEIHTSINKSINRNGLVYSSQVNVSELSKVEHQNVSQSQLIQDMPYGIAEKIPVVTEKSYGATTSFYPLVKHIREQQEKMKLLLKQHRQRIDAELDTLKREKQNIESIIPTDKKGDSIDVVLPLNPPQMLHLNKDEASQLITSALMKLHDAPQLNDIPIGITSTNCSSQSTTETPTTRPTTTMEPEKQRILKSIQHNENLTNSILNKIDRNTNMLQHFLQKLTDRIVQPNNQMMQLPKFETRKKDGTKPHRADPFFGQVMPNMEVQKSNSTLMTIPFVYAYQQPYNLPTKPDAPVASVVYQGHIHTNAINKPFKVEDKGKPTVPDKREINQTKFFFSSMEDHFPLVNAHKHYDISRIKNNNTKL